MVPVGNIFSFCFVYLFNFFLARMDEDVGRL